MPEGIEQLLKLKISLLGFKFQLLLWKKAFVGALAKIAKSDYYLSHVGLSVRPPAQNNSAPIGRIFIILIFECFGKPVKKSQFSLKFDVT